jgi:hypothetical protein
MASSFIQNICVLITEQSIKIMLYDGEDGGMRKILLNPIIIQFQLSFCVSVQFRLCIM